MSTNETAENAKMGKRLLTVPEVANYLAKTPMAVYQMVSKQQIPFVKVRRSVYFDVVKIDRWINKNSRGIHGESLQAEELPGA
jgi:excisionase family DNA binding protein